MQAKIRLEIRNSKWCSSSEEALDFKAGEIKKEKLKCCLANNCVPVLAVCVRNNLQSKHFLLNANYLDLNIYLNRSKQVEFLEENFLSLSHSHTDAIGRLFKSEIFLVQEGGLMSYFLSCGFTPSIQLSISLTPAVSPFY